MSRVIAIRPVFSLVLISCCAILGVTPNIGASVQSRRQIPTAELECTPDEAKWWEEVRSAGVEVQKNRGKKGSKKLLLLLKEGKEHTYQVPVVDRKPTFLAVFEPVYSEEARRDRLSGRIQLQVEFQSNGAVGEVVVVNGIRSDLDQKAIEAARLTLFLPAVSDRQFVSIWMPMEMTFHIY